MIFVCNYPSQPRAVLERTLRFLQENREFISAVTVSRFHLACGSRPWIEPEPLGIESIGAKVGTLDAFDTPYHSTELLPEAEYVQLVRDLAGDLPLGGFILGKDS